MQKSKLVSLLQSLSSRQLVTFEEYVWSPYFNKHEQLRKLCSYLVEVAPEWEHPRKLKKEYIFKKLYPGKKFKKATINRHASMLLHLLYDFLVSERLHSEEKSLEHKLLLLEELRKLKSNKDYHSVLQKYERIKGQLHEETPVAYFHDYLLHKELDTKFIDEGGQSFDENLQLKNNYFDIYFVLEKLRIACDMINRNIIIRSDYETTMIDFILEYSKKEEIAEIPSVQMYKAILRMRSASNAEEGDVHYKELKNLLQQYAGTFHQKELMSIYDYILNHCAKRINQGNSAYYQEMLDAYKFLVAQRIIFIDGYLASWDYRNIATVAFRVQEYDWAAEFIEKYKDMLAPSGRENVYKYNLAAYHYEIKNYGEALQTLHNVDFTDASYYIQAKTIQLKCYYELGEFVTFSSLIEAFTNFLRRNKNISDYWKQSNLSFLKISKKLQKLKSQYDYMKTNKWVELRQKLEEEIAETTPLANKDWLKDCMELLQQIS